MTIGVAISTHRRPGVLAKALAGWAEAEIPDILVVNHDIDGAGVAVTKNRGLAALMDAGCDEIFLADDDVWPVRSHWWAPYVRSDEPHLMHCWGRSRFVAEEVDTGLTVWSWPRGVLLYVRREVVERVGGMRTEFGRWGGEHAEWCCTPEARTLTEALEWVPVGSLSVGDKLIGFEEYPELSARGRKWRETKVTATKRITAPTFTVRTAGAPDVVCTGSHKWLIKRRSRSAGHFWKTTAQLQPGDQIVFLSEPWGRNDSREAGYVQGIFDGEGWMNKCQAQFGQVPGGVVDRTTDILRRHGFSLCVREQRGGHQTEDKFVNQVTVRGGVAETLRFMGLFYPQRLADKFLAHLFDKTITHLSTVTVEAVEPAGLREVVALETSTSTLLIEGMFSHNSRRIHNAGFTRHQFQDATAAKYGVWHCVDQTRSVPSSVPASFRDHPDNIRSRHELYDRFRRSTDFVPYR